MAKIIIGIYGLGNKPHSKGSSAVLERSAAQKGDGSIFSNDGVK